MSVGVCAITRANEAAGQKSMRWLVMVKLRVLQQWHGLSDQEHEGFEYVGIFDWCVLDPPPPLLLMNGLICIWDSS